MTSTRVANDDPPVQRCIALENREAWRAALTNLPHGFTHTWEHCQAMHLSSGEPTYLYCFERGAVRVVCPFVERRREADLGMSTPPGISGFTGNEDAPDLLACWTDFAVSRGYVTGYIGLHPLFARPSYAVGSTAYNSIYTLDLRGDPVDLLAGMDRNRRRELRDYPMARRQITEDRVRLLDFLILEYPRFTERVGVTGAHRWSSETMRFLGGVEDAWFLGFEHDNRVVMAQLYCVTPYAADAVLSVAIPDWRSRSTTLMWHAIQELKTRGIPVLNLGGGVADDDAIAQAKQRLGGTRRPIAALKQVYAPDRYADLCRAASREGRLHPWFPPYERPAERAR